MYDARSSNNEMTCVDGDDLENEALLLVLDDGWFECGDNGLIISLVKE